MKRIFTLILSIVAASGCGGPKEQKAESFDREEAIAACEMIIGDFESILKRELVAAMAQGGPENAVSVCNIKAPLVADSFSNLAGMHIQRVSLRQRNAGFAPDSFEVDVLKRFASSGAAELQSYGELVYDSADVKRFRYMKEIRTGELCLKCHGRPETFPEALRTVLARHYPDDPATGYQAGESRGAFAVTVTYPEAAETVKLLSARK